VAVATGAGVVVGAGSGRLRTAKITAAATAATTMDPPIMKRPELPRPLGGTERGAEGAPRGAITGAPIGITLGAAATGAAAIGMGGRGA
jgi:hypothetical protein